ncbi:MAG: LysR family transcriptional regulator [Pseudomonadota bacterium]
MTRSVPHNWVNADCVIPLGRTMIDKLRSIAIFATVVDQGTFRAAAQALGLAPSRVSETVSSLEADLGVTLLYRSTRSLSLTQDGRLLYERARAMLSEAEQGLDALQPASDDPVGRLRITAPAFVTQSCLMDRFAGFAQLYPRVDLSFDFSDARRDLIRDGFDIGLRAGWLEDSGLMARSIGSEPRYLVAHPEFLARHEPVRHPSDLEALEWIGFAMRGDQTEMHGPGGQTVRVAERARISVNSAAALYEFSTRALGLTDIPQTMAEQGIARGDLVRVLPDWELKPLGLYAVWPDQSRRENLTILFVRFLAEGRETLSA